VRVTTERRVPPGVVAGEAGNEPTRLDAPDETAEERGRAKGDAPGEGTGRAKEGEPAVAWNWAAASPLPLLLSATLPPPPPRVRAGVSDMLAYALCEDQMGRAQRAPQTNERRLGRDGGQAQWDRGRGADNCAAAVSRRQARCALRSVRMACALSTSGARMMRWCVFPPRLRLQRPLSRQTHGPFRAPRHERRAHARKDRDA
jgi:hypothetical protein